MYLVALFAVAAHAASPQTAAPPTTNVALSTSDGVTVQAVEQGKGANAVVLVHDKNKSSADWTYFQARLAQNGYHTLAIDLRGQGASKPPNALTDADWPKMVKDVDAAVEWLKAKGATKIAIVGAQFGADLAVNAAAEEPSVTNLVLLTPDLNVSGVLTAAPLEKYGARPVLLVASDDDAYGGHTVTTLEDKAVGDKHVEIVESAGKGVQMLTRDADLEGVVVSWLNGTYHLQDNEKATSRAGVSTGDASSVQTTGTKFGDKKSP